MKGKILFITLLAMVVCAFAEALELTWPTITVIGICLVLVIGIGWLIWIEPSEVIGQKLKLEQEEGDAINSYFLIQFLKKKLKI